MGFFSFGNRSEPSSAFTEHEVRLLTWTRVLEESALSQNEVTRAELKDLTTQTAREVGEQATFHKLLLTRAQAVLDFLKQKGVRGVKLPQGIPYRTIGIAIGLLAFVGGLLTNEFTVTDDKINLLSPPLLGVIAWNIIVYCWIAASFFLNKGKMPFGPIRKGLSKLLLFIQSKGGRGQKDLLSFYEIWGQQESKLLKLRVSEILHFSAMLFGLGLIASIGIHGWGTAYTVGWESTWLSDKPSAVLTFINLFYGLIPLNSELFNELTPQAVSAMQFGHGAGDNAAPWLLQLFYNISLVVVLPRFVLGSIAALRANRLQNKFPLDQENVYYSNILRQWKGKTMFIHIIPFSYPLNEALKSGVQTLVGEIHPETSRCVFSEAAHEDSALPEFASGEQTEVIALFAMTATPEVEVQGNFIKELKAKAQKSDALVRVLVDSSGFEARFAKTPQRIAERKKNWTDFLSNYAVSFAFVNLLHLDSKSVVKQFEEAR